MTRNQRSEKARLYRKLYATKRWQDTRDRQFAKQPLCELCAKQKRITAANVCHHVKPETKDDPLTFFAGPFMSLCAPCHDGPVQSAEKTGGEVRITGLDGWPA